jgi:hypothetical protein
MNAGGIGLTSKLRSIQERASEKIDGDLGVVLGIRSKPRQRGSLFVFAGSIKATETDHQIAQSGEILGSVFGSGGGQILTESNIANVVEGVLDGPVAPAESLDLSGVHFGGRATGEEDFGFFGNANGFEMMSGALNHSRLDGMRESRALRSDFKGIDLTGFMATVALVQSDIRRGKKRRSRPWTARRVCRRAWADWL